MKVSTSPMKRSGDGIAPSGYIQVTTTVMRIIGTVLLEQSEVWGTDRLYFEMTEYLEYISEAEKLVAERSMQTETELPKEEEAAENCVAVRAA